MNANDYEYQPHTDTSPMLPETPLSPAPPPLPQPGIEKAETPPISRGSFLALIGLIIAADWCLYSSWGGTGTAVFNLIAGACLLLFAPERVRTRPLLLGSAILLLATACIWQAWWLPMSMIFAALGLLAVSVHRPDWNLLETGWASLTALIPGKQILLFLQRIRGIAAPVFRSRNMRGIPVRALVIPLVVTTFFLWIFSRANMIVSWISENFFEVVLDVVARAPDYFSFYRVAFWLIAFALLAPLLRPVIRSRLVQKMLALNPRCQPVAISNADRMNFLTAASTLICVNLLFLAYNALDSVYLYFKSTLPAGMNWTEYTHSGCGWLTLALFASSAILATIFWHSLNFHPQSARLKQLAYIWVAQNGVLAIGAIRRLQMYIDYSGLTHLIITGIYGSLLVMAGLLIMARKVQRNHSAIWLLRRYVSAFCAGVLILALTPYGYICAEYNVPRVLADKPNALWPIVLKNQPADALPALLPLLDYERADGNTGKQKKVRRGVAGLLGMQLRKLERESSQTWQQWQLSKMRALPALKAAESRILEECPEEIWMLAHKNLAHDYELMSGSKPRNPGMGVHD